MPDQFSPLGVVRTEQSRSALLETGVPSECVVVADVTDAAAFASAIKGCSALIIGTSAKPAPTGDTDPDSGRPVFSFPNGSPEIVDWLGQKSQIDAAKACGPETHVVICSSMGGTDPSNMLKYVHCMSRLARARARARVHTRPLVLPAAPPVAPPAALALLARSHAHTPTRSHAHTLLRAPAYTRSALGRDAEGKGGDILLWKRKAEKYLIDSGLPYTIVHPGGLLNEPGGKRELCIGVDDSRDEGERSIPREDVAEVLVQALRIPSYRGRSFDIRSKNEGEGEVTTDFEALLAKLDGANCDYSLGKIA